MSKSLLKKSLEMFKDDLLQTKGSSKKKKRDDPMKVISTNRKGVKKELRRVKRQEEVARQLRIKKGKPRTAVDDYVDMQDYDMTEENILQIQRISSLSKTSKFATEKVLEHQRGTLAKNRPPEEQKAAEIRTVLFDDEEEKSKH